MTILYLILYESAKERALYGSNLMRPLKTGLVSSAASAFEKLSPSSMWSRKAVSTIAATAACLMYQRKCGAQEHARHNMCPCGRSGRALVFETARTNSRLPRQSAASAAFVILFLLRVALQDDKKTHEDTYEVHK